MCVRCANKHGLSHEVLNDVKQWLSKWAASPLGGKGVNKTKRENGEKQHKGGENAQPLPLIDH